MRTFDLRVGIQGHAFVALPGDCGCPGDIGARMRGGLEALRGDTVGQRVRVFFFQSEFRHAEAVTWPRMVDSSSQRGPGQTL